VPSAEGCTRRAATSNYCGALPNALRDLANGFDEHGYLLDRNSVTVEVSGKLVSAEGQTPSDAIRKLAWIIEERGYAEQDFPGLDWNRIVNELPLVSA